MDIKKKKDSYVVVTATMLVLYFLIFLIYPIFRAVQGSFHDWNPLIDRFDFVGLENYRSVLGNPLLWKTLRNTFVFTLASVFFRIIVGLGTAVLLNSSLIKRKAMFRGIFYLPTVTPLVAVSFVWMWLYNPQFGLINKVFNLDINWLHNSKYALPAVIIMTIWKDFGYSTVMYLAGIMGIPEQVNEASKIDGANRWQQFKHVTLPLLRPTTFFIVVTSLIAYLQAYVQILIMTEGGPGTATFVISYLIYNEAFVNYNFGKASALAMILFLLIAILTLILFGISNRRKLYE